MVKVSGKIFNYLFVKSVILLLILSGLSCREYFNENDNINDASFSDGIAIAFVVPKEGPSDGGTSVTIQGIGFTSNSTVYFGDKQAVIKIFSDSQLKVTTPAIQLDTSAIFVNVIVKNIDTGFSDTAKNAFRYYNIINSDTLFISGVDPASGPNNGGINVSIKGQGFKSDSHVFFGDSAEAVIFNISPSEIDVVLPPATGKNSYLMDSLVDVKVLNINSNRQYVLQNAFKYGEKQ